MPFSAIADHPGFFGALFGAVAGGAGAWAAMSTWVRQIRDDMQVLKGQINEKIVPSISALEVLTKHLWSKDDCHGEQSMCQRILCRKIDELVEFVREDGQQTARNAEGIAAIREALLGLEKRYEDDRADRRGVRSVVDLPKGFLP